MMTKKNKKIHRMRKKKCKLTTNKKNSKQLTYNNNNKLAYEETPKNIIASKDGIFSPVHFLNLREQ